MKIIALQGKFFVVNKLLLCGIILKHNALIKSTGDTNA